MTLISKRASGAATMLLLVGFVLAGCGGKDRKEQQLGMANPASVYCEEQGGKLEIRHEKDGEVGYCHLPYGRVVEEWVLWRAAHHDEASQ
ncbi:DUF333 domain-containing protein [Asaia sp. BMEF1]|uniref:putative hemolysin n=1 Tax=unclassified Asaia TaxID=2685023 RepID=UPI0030175F49